MENPINYWKLAKRLTVDQAAYLIIGLDPGHYEHGYSNGEPDGFHAVYGALKDAIYAVEIEAQLWFQNPNGTDGVFISNKSAESAEIPQGFIVEPYLRQSMIHRDALKVWLESRNFRPAFFFEDEKIDDFLNVSHPNYAPKLAAAITAWMAVTRSPELLNGKTPKQALDKWLREHANKYGLTKDDGNPNKTGIEEVCKIANWNPEGGAAKTPTRVTKNPPTPSSKVGQIRAENPIEH